ncbi:hypothetical protein GCM10007160_20430 [Litchfieldella qijiaojingensis]|uniref:Endolytic peptidoglycan transglycosylase RlpA n=1 Tax=Litchfieldella qijiaojingensis TaxID=980347 RepID=A0ABQ2YRE8_9GAMM|nr:septal ring lytic transglycosylase RlpA family protein [Halomonas qijiaojingensis]GGX92818.1 hypothetical protein GCM10007160_20430 [Halomonas qijiaojingensis]
MMVIDRERFVSVRGWANPLVVFLVVVLLAGCASRDARQSGTAGVAEGRVEEGLASYYADRYHGRPTASGERFDQQELTAAHRSLPFGTRVRVTHLDNGRQTVVRINDRGPYVRGRIIDLSRRAARELGMESSGTARVRVTPVR